MVRTQQHLLRAGGMSIGTASLRFPVILKRCWGMPDRILHRTPPPDLIPPPGLLEEVRASLEELALGLDGALNMSEGMEALSKAIAGDNVPRAWMAAMSTRYQEVFRLARWFQVCVRVLCVQVCVGWACLCVGLTCMCGEAGWWGKGWAGGGTARSVCVNPAHLLDLLAPCT